MINRLFRSASRVSGIALPAMVVGAVALPPKHAPRIISHAAPASGETSATVAKVDVGFVPYSYHHFP